MPHLGASTPEAEDNCAAMAARELVDYIENGNITHSVNYPDVCAPRSSVCRITVMHENVKEVISKITSLISAGGINIANLLDKSKGNTAYMLLDLDDIPDDSVIEKIKAMESVSRVRVFC